MALPITVPYTFGNATTAIPLSNLDSDYATVYQAVNGIGNGSVALANVAITGGTISGNTTASNVTVSSGTFTNVTLSNVTISSVSTPITAAEGGTGSSSAFTANGVVYASSTSALATGSALTFDGTNFGVGTSSPAAKLESFITSTSTPALRLRYNSSSYYADHLMDGNGNYVIKAPTANGVASGNVLLQAAGTLYLYTNNAEAARIDTSGNLGLGVTPIGWGGNVLCLHGDSALAFQGANGLITANAYYNGGWKYTTTAAASYYYQIGGAHQWTTAPSGTAGNPITFTQAMTLDASANLLVGTTSTSVTNGGYAFLINGGASYAPIGHATGTSSGAAYLAFRYNNSDIGSITQSGTTAVLYNLTSDQRLKENIKDAEDAATLIDAIQVRQYDWKSDGSHQRYGFIAQELVTVAPEAVHQPTDPDEMMAVDYSKLVPMLVKEIQSLRKRILTLENK